MDDRIAIVIAHIEATLEQGPRLSTLAEKVNLSESRLAHLFRAEVGVAPGRYVHAIRMQRARVLLERTFLSVKEVMARVGINDPSHFARDFRRYHGIAPSHIKRGSGQPTEGPPALLLTHLDRAADQRHSVAHDGGPQAVHDAPRDAAVGPLPPAPDGRCRAEE